MGEEVHEERTVEILAELVENKPRNKERILDFFVETLERTLVEEGAFLLFSLANFKYLFLCSSP